MPADRFLVIRLSAVGDVVNTLPMLSLLRTARPDAFVGFLVEDRAQDLLVGHPLVDRVHVFPRRRWRTWSTSPRRWARLLAEAGTFVREIREQRYEVALDVQGNLKGGVQALLSGADRRIGFARGHDRELNHWLSTERVVPPADRPHRVDKFASLLAALGIAPDGERRWVFPDAAVAEAEVAAFSAKHAIVPGTPVILHPGTSGRGAAKRWPSDSFRELARRVVGELGRPVVVTWGPGEEALAHSVAGGLDRVWLTPPTPSLLTLLAWIRTAAVFVSADTGPMHLAAASGVRCVALFGPKDPAVYAPYGPDHLVLHRPGGMHLIAVEEVLAAVADRLRAP